MQKSTNPPTLHIATTILLLALVTLSPGHLSAQGATDAPTDPEATLFLQKCIQCHEGLFAGKELVGTHNRPIESLEAAVRRMQEHTGPLTEKQIADLVALMHDKDFVFRLEEAKLESEDRAAETIKSAEAKGIAIDKWAINFMQSCATCHTMGGGRSSGGDLIHTVDTTTDTLRQHVSRMQVHVGPMTPEQIDGLTALLKHPDRISRLQAQGLKSQAALAAEIATATPYVPAPTPHPTPSPTPRRPQTQIPRPETAAAPTSHVQHTGQKLPVGLLVGMSIFTFFVIVGSYFMYIKPENDSRKH